MTETHTIKHLARLVKRSTGAKIAYVDNPRKEDAQNELNVKNDKFLALGLTPTTLDKGLFEEVTKIAFKYKSRCDVSKIPCMSRWVDNDRKSALPYVGKRSNQNQRYFRAV